MADLLRIARSFGADETASAAAAWASAFPEPGVYRVERLEHFAKAAGVSGQPTDEFEEWFLRRLFEVSRENFVDSQGAIWEVLDDLLRARGVVIPSQLDQWELGRTLFDLTHASTAHMVGFRVPADVTHRLTELGWKPPEVLDFPALAYRMGLIYHELQSSAPAPWPRLLELAEARRLSTIEQLAVDAARSRAGVWLRPIFDDTGHVWTAERELEPLRELTSRAIAERRGYRAAARELGKTNRAQGIFRDTERVMRTEIATANGQANWADQSKRWETETKIYRPTTATPCRDCIRLYKLPDGMPRLYTRAEVEAESAKGPNTGPRDTWGPRIGPTHPNCFPGESMVALPGLPTRGFQRRYIGDLVEIATVDGDRFSCTPNHPVLTTYGWVAAGALHVGCHVISCGGRDRVLRGGVNSENRPTRIEQVVNTLRSSRDVIARPVPVAAEDFHGDGEGSEVAVVFANGLLGDGFDATLSEQLGEQLLIGMHGAAPFVFARTFLQLGFGTLAATHSCEGCGRDALSVINGRRRIEKAALFALATYLYSLKREDVLDRVALSSQAGGDMENARPAQVVPDDLLNGSFGDCRAARVASVVGHAFAGDVFNLSTPGEWYLAGGVVVHNCCCPPWQTWQEALRPILSRRAARFAEMIKTLRVFDERKAA